ncbi:hypothetical protein S7711_04839 [Stachybotrys chartarum IBT 7711]|uniref:Uncharacterized protein n=1 Tax=Stachybotrys chartarum (strain CBS 109288 / IBT 7711) TaxID=1280523 RepID=A0A084AMI4_STACB|nr:hypothetical protein S7711_04839 [Stachybotrys chartarum IBT 7711]
MKHPSAARSLILSTRPLSPVSIEADSARTSGHDYFGRATATNMNTSFKSNPFASDHDDEIELEDFSYIHARDRFSVDSLPQAPQKPFTLNTCDLGRSLTHCRFVPKPDHDKAGSDWETVASVTDFQEPTKPRFKGPERRREFQVVFHAHGAPNVSQGTRPGLQRRNTIIGPPDVSLPKLPGPKIQHFMPRDNSFVSSSSIYSDVDEACWTDGEALLHLDLDGARLLGGRPTRRATLGFGVNQYGELTASCSKSSSSASGDRFKYDGGLYSTFLHTTTEKGVDGIHMPRAGRHAETAQAHGLVSIDDEVKVKIKKQDGDDTNDGGRVPFKANAGLGALLGARADTGTNSDWQTVTTDAVRDTTAMTDSNLVKRTLGSSVADVSDYFQLNAHQAEYGTVDRIIQHPTQPESEGFYCIRNDRQTNRPLLVPRFADKDAAAFPQNSCRAIPQPSNPVAAAMRKFSNPFQRDHQNYRSGRTNNVFELDTWTASYESLESDAFDAYGHAQKLESSCKVDEERELGGWSRVYGHSERNSPLTPCTTFDHAHLEPEVKSISPPDSAIHGLRDELPYEISRLPFPLVSLPEAALVQQFRRERGEEDHTEAAGSFAARRNTRTISTVSSSNCPQTPLSARFHNIISLSDTSIPVPALVRCSGDNGRISSETQIRRNKSNADRSVMHPDFRRPSSSSILGTATSRLPPSRPQTCDSEDRQTQRSAPSLISPRLLRLRSCPYPSRNYHGQARGLMVEQDNELLFTPSENNLIRLAREDIMFRRRCVDGGNRRQRIIFIVIVGLTVAFPLTGLIALWGKFDSTISWYTCGELHNLTSRQRAVVRRQLFLEAICYPVLIVTLVVYYSVHG